VGLFLQIHQLRKDVKVREEEIALKEAEWTNTAETMKNNIVDSYAVSFEAALEQVCIIHPGIDFSEVIPCNAMVDGKLVKDL